MKQLLKNVIALYKKFTPDLYNKNNINIFIFNLNTDKLKRYERDVQICLERD
jgi:hypothetical protein